MDVSKHENFQFIDPEDDVRFLKVANITSFKLVTGEYESNWTEVTSQKVSGTNKIPGNGFRKLTLS